MRNARVIPLVVILAGACGGTTSSPGSNPDAGNPFDSGSTDSSTMADGGVTDGAGAGVKARAIARANGGAAAGCMTVPPFMVGEFGDPSTGDPAKAVDDGGSWGGKAVGITCRVAPAAGGGFELAGEIAIAGDASLTIKATLDGAGKTNDASFTLAKGSTQWSSLKCNLDPGALAPQGGVAAGRFWSLLSCVGSTSNNGATCDIFGQVRFENCKQD